MNSTQWSEDRAIARFRDRLEWAEVHGPLPKLILQVPLRRRIKALIMATPVIGPWLFTRMRQVYTWIKPRLRSS